MSGRRGFAVWITGIPASGKSTITRELADKMHALQVPIVVLESDEMRRILTPEANYSREERDRFYHLLASLGAVIIRSGVNVIFDATANRRAYRDGARTLIKDFLEVYVHCPLDICTKRDPKGIYRRAMAGTTKTVPGLQEPYEPPLNPDIQLDGREPPERSADTILEKLKQLLYI